MVKKPEPSKEQFRLLKEQIHFWERSIESAKAMLKSAKAAKNKNVRALRKLERMYPE